MKPMTMLTKLLCVEVCTAMGTLMLHLGLPALGLLNFAAAAVNVYAVVR